MPVLRLRAVTGRLAFPPGGALTLLPMRLPELRPRLPLLAVALAAMAGIAAADWWRLAPGWPLAATGALGIALFLRPRTFTLWALAGAASSPCTRCGTTAAKRACSRRRSGPEPAVATATGVVWSEPQAPRVWSRIPPAISCCSSKLCRPAGAAARDSAARAACAGRARCRRMAIACILLGSLPPARAGAQSGQFRFRRRTSGGTASSSKSRAAIPADCTMLEPRPRRVDAAVGHRRAALDLRHCLELDLHDAPEILLARSRA